MSRLIIYADLHEGSRPASASAVPESSSKKTLPVKVGKKRMRRSLSMSNTNDGTMTVRSLLSLSAGFSSSLDEESRLEESLPLSTTNAYYTALDQELPTSSLSSFQPHSEFSKRKITKMEEIRSNSISTPVIKLKPRPPRSSGTSTNPEQRSSSTPVITLKPRPPRSSGTSTNPEQKSSSIPVIKLKPRPQRRTGTSMNPEQRSSSTPVIKLKPRPQRRTGTSIHPRMNECCGMMPSSFKTTPPKIFIPFLSSRSTYSSPPLQKQEQKQQSQQQTLLPVHPLIPQFLLQSPSAPSTPDGSKIRRASSIPIPLQRQKKTKWTRSVSTPLSSPPQLIPSFDYFGISSATRDIITPPPISARPPAPFTTPPQSAITTQVPMLMDSIVGETTYYKYKYSGERVVLPAVMAKPIARRPLITPSDRHNNRTGSGSDSSYDDCTPKRLFAPGSIGNHNIGDPAASLSSSMECSAFSFSSVVPSASLSTTMRRRLSADYGE